MAEPPASQVDLDVNELPPREFVRLLITRACGGDSLAWAEISWDLARYRSANNATCVLLGITEQLIGLMAEERGLTSVELWRALMLDEALSGPDLSGGP